MEAILLLILVAAFLGAVFLAAAETALLRVSRVRAETLARHRGRQGERLAALVTNLPGVLNTILLSALLAQITAATVTGLLAQRLFGSVGVTIASVLLTMLLFIYAEAIPKTFAVRHPDRVGLAVSRPISVLATLLRPLVAALVWIADLQAPGKGIATAPTVTEDELRRLAGFAATEGEIHPAERTLIDRVFRFGDRRAVDIMVPRTDIVAVPSVATVDEALSVALGAGHRRLVVYEQTLDTVVGVVRLRDLAAVTRRDVPITSFTSEPLTVPESKDAVALLTDMQSAGMHLAIVIDEYGGTAGLVTVEDIVEELLGAVGEDRTEPMITKIGEQAWSIAGMLPVEDLADILDAVPEGEWNTVGGLVVGLLGHLPHPGDEVRIDGHVLRVVAVRGRRVHRLSVSPSDA